MSWASHPQAGSDGGLRHLLTLDGLPRRHLEHLLRWAARYLVYLTAGSVSPAPGSDDAGHGVLAGSCVVPMFVDMEEQAACVAAALALGADVRFCPGFVGAEATSLASQPLVGGAGVAGDGVSSRRLIDWLPALADARYLILQHGQNGAPFLFAAHCAAHQQIVNAGDGSYAHPIRALCNILDIVQRKPDLAALRVAILGDIAGSGVARSTLHALTTLGAPEIRVVGPTALSFEAIAQLGATWYADPEIGLADMDAVVVLSTDRAQAGDTSAAYVRFGERTDADGDAFALTPPPNLVVQAVWMAVFAVLAGCADENVHRVIGWQGMPYTDDSLDVPPINPGVGDSDGRNVATTADTDADSRGDGLAAEHCRRGPASRPNGCLSRRGRHRGHRRRTCGLRAFHRATH
ncbi:hypothetical protein [Robbsia sp. KACC 23696]|uniref:hypothetical protein n=1 Tax=Robbsia sp. KACC 23696 TaxID=3149231 RepID=UPI00325BC5A6